MLETVRIAHHSVPGAQDDSLGFVRPAVQYVKIK